MSDDREPKTLYLELAEEASADDPPGRTVVTKQRKTTDENAVFLPLTP